MEPSPTPQANLAKLRIDRPDETAEGGGPGRIVLVALAALALAGGGWAAWAFWLKPLPSVKVFRVPAPAAAGAGGALDASGYLVPQRRADIASKVAGVIAAVAVEEGDQVAERQELAHLANEEEKAAVEEATGARDEMAAERTEAEKARAEAGARAEEARRGLEEAAARRAEAEKLVGEASARAEEARRDWERKKKLQQSGDIGDAELDAAESAAKAAESRLQAAQAGAEAAESRRQGAESAAKAWAAREEAAAADAVAAEARWRAAEARVKAAQARLEDTIIRSPIAGRVTARKIHPGEAASPAGITTGSRGGALFTVADFASLEAEVDVSESRLGELRAGHAARVAVDAVPDRRFRGELRQIVPTADRARAVVKVKVRLLEGDPRLLPDMALRVTFVADGAAAAAAPSGPRVPQAAVVSAGGRDVVWIVQDGRAASRPVTLGERAEGQVEIKSGLAGGETVIVGNSVPLSEGLRVKVETP